MQSLGAPSERGASDSKATRSVPCAATGPGAPSGAARRRSPTADQVFDVPPGYGIDAETLFERRPTQEVDRIAKTTPAMQSRVLVGRRYLEHGFLDAAMRLFGQNPEMVEPDDWTELSEKMIERDRIEDAVRVCELGGVPLPRERLLAMGDRYLQRRDTDRAIHFYETGHADQERWSRILDVLTTSPGMELRAIELAERHLVSEPRPGETHIAIIE